MTHTIDTLPPLSAQQSAAILAAPRTSDAHRALMAATPAMSLVEHGGTAPDTALPADFTIAAWNVERCLFPQASADLMAAHGADIVLLSEMDSGMARTGQRNTTAEMAAVLGMAYVYGVEFHEMDLGGATERPYCVDDFNLTGWHGNAILSRVPFRRVELIRLDDHGHWFAGGDVDPGQPRIGGRMAIAVEVATASGPICAVTTHLESNANAAHRQMQMQRLLDAVDSFAPDMPVIIGGDLNTGNHIPPDFDWRAETLFDYARTRGYDWQATADGLTTRKSLLTPHADRQMKLDWFCRRGLTGPVGKIVPALDPQGQALSDHEAIVATMHRP